MQQGPIRTFRPTVLGTCTFFCLRGRRDSAQDEVTESFHSSDFNMRLIRRVSSLKLPIDFAYHRVCAILCF